MIRHDTLLLSCGTPANRSHLRAVLEENYNLLEASNTRQTLLLLRQNIDCIAAVVIDTADPDALDRALLQEAESAALLRQVPVIVILPTHDQTLLDRAFALGASDVIPLDYDQFAMRKRIGNIAELSLHKRNLELLVREQADILRHANDTMVDALSSIIEYRSVESGQHILRIRHFTRILLEEVARGCPEYGLTERIIRIISSAAALHDVGKIAIPDAILTKPGPLTDAEREIMKTHSRTGCEILASLGDMGDEEYLRYAHNICHYHHERWDGTGYPEGLAGDEIPICAQVVGLADCYDALTSRRVYKDAFSFGDSVNMILRGECGTFSPKLLECFKRVTVPFENLAKAYADGLSPRSESFDTALPPPEPRHKPDSLETTRAKYLALVHYINGFLIELDLDRELFHLIYNPFPELAPFDSIRSFSDIRRLLVDVLAAPEDRDRMRRFVEEEIPAFLDNSHRRATFFFRFRSPDLAGDDRYEITLLRINPASEQRTLAVLCRRAEPGSADTGSRLILSDSTYVCRFDDHFTLERLTGTTQLLAGYTRRELQEHFRDRLISLIHPQDRGMVLDHFRTQLCRGTTVELEYRLLDRDGGIRWVLDRSRLVVEPDGREHLYGFLTDTTHTHRAQEDLMDKLRRYEIILAQTENVLFEWDVRRDTISFSDTWEKIFGYTPITESVTNTLRSGSYFHPDDLPLLLDRVRNLESGSAYESVEVRIATSRGHYLWCRFRASALRQEGRLHKIVGVILNIDAEKQAQRALQDRAERDALTRLLNKQAGLKHAEDYLAQFPGGIRCALLIIDLDNFKQVNDQYGHLFGDAVLTRTAREIRNLFRSQDIIARIGGDEFMVLMRGISDRALVENRCRQLLSALRDAFREQGRNLGLSCSIGVAMAPEDGRGYQELFQRADKALYAAKDRGRNTFVFYDPTGADFRRQRRTTSVNNRIDSDHQPGLADNSLVQYAFQRLYTAGDVHTAINDCLGTVGRLMNVSRVYVFENSPDNRFCSNTYEWCNTGIAPEIANLQNISYADDIPGYADSFDENDILYCSDIAQLPAPVYDIVAPQGIQSMLHCAIREGGVFRGYIGFDDCTGQRLWTREQIDALTYFSGMLSVFLLKQRAQERTAQRSSDLSSILDNQNACIYIIDPDTCALQYLNAKTRALAPAVTEGMLCYQALMGNPHRCPGCPSLGIRQKKNDSALMRNDKLGVTALAEATLVTWQGEESCLLTCRTLPDNSI